MPEDLPGYEITQSDIEYFAKKLGLDILTLRRERVQKERDESLARAQAHQAKHERAEELHRAELTKQFFKRQGKSFFVFLNGKPITVKKLDESIASCPVIGCHGHLPSIRGWVISLIEKNPIVLLDNLSAYQSILCIDTQINCNGTVRGQPKHTSHIQIQQLAVG